MFKIYLMLFTLLFSNFTFGNSSGSTHCKMFLNESFKDNFSHFLPDLKRLLKENKDYDLSFFETGDKIGSGSLYLEIKSEVIKKIERIRVNRFSNKKSKEMVSTGSYPPCKVTLIVKRSQRKIVQSETDNILTTQFAKRDRPRLTRSGHTRCIYALKDALAKLPKCE